MAPFDPRSAYRDELNAARLRIELLEADLAAARAGEPAGGRALVEAEARASELADEVGRAEEQAREAEARAKKLEARVRELERASAGRVRRATERAAARACAGRPGCEPAGRAKAKGPGDLTWAALGLITLAALVVLGSLQLGPLVAIVAVVSGAAASHAFYLRLSGRRPDGARAVDVALTPRPAPGRFRPAGPPRPQSPPPRPPAPAPSAPKTRFTAKRGRD